MVEAKLLHWSLQRGEALRVTHKEYGDWIKKFVVGRMLADIGKEDVTSNAVLSGKKEGEADIVAKDAGIVAGVEEVAFIFKQFSIGCKVMKRDGDSIRKGDVVLALRGEVRFLLKAERGCLDVLSRMSGIATLTKSLVGKVKGKVEIAPTRKTPGGLLDKKAVFVGGGVTHRLGLWEAILIKDTHLHQVQAEGFPYYVTEALLRAWNHKGKARFIEIEVGNSREALEAAAVLSSFPKKIPLLLMFDNMRPGAIAKTLKELAEGGLSAGLLFEASGSITAARLLDYAKSGVDVVSMGCLTHSVVPLDMSLEMIA